MNEIMMKRLYQPVLYFFLLPVFYIALGSMFALRYQSFNYVSFIFLYVFILINQMLENVLLRIPTTDFKLSKSFIIILELLLALILFFFAWRHSWLAAVVLFAYALIIQSQFLFSYYELDLVAILLANFVKIMLLNGFSFYIHTDFIHYRFIPYYLGIFIPFLLYERSRLDTKPDSKIITALSIATYLIGIFLLWEHLQFYSLLLLLSLPFIRLLTNIFNKKTTAMYAITFSSLFILLIAWSFLF